MARPSELERQAMRPKFWVRFWRTFWPYQLLRFVIINVRMLVVILLSHRTHPAPPKQPERGERARVAEPAAARTG